MGRTELLSPLAATCGSVCVPSCLAVDGRRTAVLDLSSDFHTSNTATTVTTTANAAVVAQRHHPPKETRSRSALKLARRRSSSPALGSTATYFERAALSSRSSLSSSKLRQPASS